MIDTAASLAADVDAGRHDDFFVRLYGRESVDLQKQRYRRLLDLLRDDHSDCSPLFVIGPGRTELGGNHTDHNHGCVLAAAVDLDCVAAITPVDAPEVTLISENYPDPIRVDLKSLSPRPEEEGRPESLVRGVAAAFHHHTGKCGGFHGRLQATCLPGTGLSSSAAFSVLVGAAFNFLYHGGRLTPQLLAQMAQQAENDYFNKPCGLMDQMASAMGGTIFIDFDDPAEPVITPIDHDLARTGYRLALIDTGTSHVGLTPEYAAINTEMCSAAEVLGQPFGRGITVDRILASLPEIRKRSGDRAALRLLHFVEENDRVQTMASLLQSGNFSDFLHHVENSGISSCNLLQNCATVSSSREQGVLLALALSRRICPRAVCRVHGGGFAGTVQVYVPDEEFAEFCYSMEAVFGGGSVMPVRLGRPGVCGLSTDGLVLPGRS